MSWKFPKHPIKNRRVPDAEAMNENFLSAGQELVGRLNEHNWKANTFTQSEMSNEAAFVYHTASGIRNEIPWSLPGTSAVPWSGSSDYQVLNEKADWAEITDSVLVFSSPICLAWIHASIQLYSANPTALGSATPQTQIAIKIDGTVIPETITGGTEPEQNPNMGGASEQDMNSLVTTVVLPLAPGAHRITIVLRSVGHVQENDIWAASNELICLEMRA
jgi:hypothetical protein